MGIRNSDQYWHNTLPLIRSKALPRQDTAELICVTLPWGSQSTFQAYGGIRAGRDGTRSYGDARADPRHRR